MGTDDGVQPCEGLETAKRKVIEGLGTVGTNTFNPHGKYRYVSIDRYFEVVAHLAAQYGITWVVRETSACLTQTAGKDIAMFRYEVDVYFGDHILRGYDSHTILHPLQGPQTSGSAKSYANKLFMRNMFFVATGEEDADSVSPKSLEEEFPDRAEATPYREQAPPLNSTDEAMVKVNGQPQLVEGGWNVVEKVLKELVFDKCTSDDDVKGAFTENSDVLQDMKVDAPDAYQRVIDHIRQVREGLANA